MIPRRSVSETRARAAPRAGAKRCRAQFEHVVEDLRRHRDRQAGGSGDERLADAGGEHLRPSEARASTRPSRTRRSCRIHVPRKPSNGASIAMYTSGLRFADSERTQRRPASWFVSRVRGKVRSSGSARRAAHTPQASKRVRRRRGRARGHRWRARAAAACSRLATPSALARSRRPARSIAYVERDCRTQRERDHHGTTREQEVEHARERRARGRGTGLENDGHGSDYPGVSAVVSAAECVEPFLRAGGEG